MHVLGTARTDARVLREASALVDAGHTVTIVDIEPATGRPRVETLDGVRMLHLVMPSWFTPARFKPWFLVKLMRVIVAGIHATWSVRADVYHAHDANALFACYATARLRRKPLVLDAHELPFVEPSTMRWRLLTLLTTGVTRRLFAGCQAIITVSPPIVDELRQRYGGPHAVVVRNALPYRVPIASDRLRRAVGADSSTRIALYQGNLQEDRGLSRLVYAAQHLQPGCMIVLMGQGPSERMLHDLILREGVGDRVRILPAVPYVELLEWTVSASVGLIVYPPSHSPNVRLCLPNKLFEYQMAGLPVLASALPAVADVVTRYDFGCILASVEPEAMGRAINAMLTDTSSLQRWHDNALAVARDELNWEHEQERLIELYRDLMMSNSAQPSTGAKPVVTSA